MGEATNWEDELIEDCREDDGTLHPQTDHVLSGAHWMLRRLRDDEAVERAAESMFEADWEDEDDFAQIGRSSFANLHKEGREYYRDRAKGTITALLGED